MPPNSARCPYAAPNIRLKWEEREGGVLKAGGISMEEEEERELDRVFHKLDKSSCGMRSHHFLRCCVSSNEHEQAIYKLHYANKAGVLNKCCLSNINCIWFEVTPCGEVKSTPFLQTLPKPSIDGGKKVKTQLRLMPSLPLSAPDPLYSHLFLPEREGRIKHRIRYWASVQAVEQKGY